MSTEAHQARQTIKQQKKAGTLINASGRDTTRSAIFLDNGSVIASPYYVNKLMSDIAKANAREPSAKRSMETARVKIFDAVAVDSGTSDEQQDEQEESE